MRPDSDVSLMFAVLDAAGHQGDPYSGKVLQMERRGPGCSTRRVHGETTKLEHDLLIVLPSYGQITTAAGDYQTSSAALNIFINSDVSEVVMIKKHLGLKFPLGHTV